ncbi:MAG: MFS transporter [Acidimicrobiales bacterium]
MTLTPFSRLVTASACSNLADGVFQVALPLVALGLTRDPAAFAAVSLVGRLPWLLVALPAGAYADRLDRRRTMVVANVARAVLLGLLTVLVAADAHTMWSLYLVAFGLGVAEVFFDTAAQSIVPNIVPADRLTSANARLYAVELTANQFVGPPLGGVLVAVAATLALGLSAGAYALGAVLLLVVAGAFRPRRDGPPTRVRTDIVEGVRYLVGHRVLRVLAVCTGLTNLAFTATFSVFALYVVSPGPVGLSEAGFGLLLVAPAVGSLAGTVVVDRVVRRVGRTAALSVSILLGTALPLAPALSAEVVALALGGAVSGIAIVVWNVVTVSLRQRIAPDALLGRVNAGYRLVAWGSMPVGAALGGVVGSAYGVRSVFWASVVLSVLCLPLLLTVVSDEVLSDAEGATAGRDDGP